MNTNRCPFVTLMFLSIFLFATAGRSQDQEASPQALYQTYCSNCHGTQYQGGNAQSLTDGIWQYGEGRGYRFRNIKFGMQHLGMPAYENTLTDDQIWGIVNYLEEVEKSANVSEPPIPDTCYSLDYDINIDIIAEGLEVPWGIAFPDQDTVLVTERPGPLRIIKNGVLQSEPVAGTPEVLDAGQGGMLDVAVDPDYAANGWVYLCYSHALPKQPHQRRAPAMTRLVRGRIKNNRWVNEEVIYEAPHETYRTTRHHYGCRIVFDSEGYLYFCIGDRGHKENAQVLDRPNGKVHRIYPDGRIPNDNPFVDKAGVLPTIYSYGHRNPQGLSVHPETGRIWEVEHGPLGGDELNLITKAVNYGWPVITYGRNYNGTIISELEAKPGMEQPILYWKPSIAVCACEFYDGELFPKWKNHLLVTALKYEELTLLDIKEQRAIHSQSILKNAGRIRDVGCGPDGAVYVVLNSPGSILRLTPQPDKAGN